MDTNISASIEDLQKRVDGFRNHEPSKQELRDFSRDYLTARRLLDQLDRALTKSYADYSMFYVNWVYRHENEQQSLVQTGLHRSQLEIEY